MVTGSPNLRLSRVKTAILSQSAAPTSTKPETKVTCFFQTSHLAPFLSLPTREARCWSTGATPIAHFLGAIVSGSQAALMSSAKDLNLQVGHVKWHATGKYDVRGVRGEEVRCMKSQPHTGHVHRAVIAVLEAMQNLSS